MSFLLGRLLGGSAVRQVETRAATAGGSGLLTKIALGGAALSVASPILSSLSSIPVVGQAFAPSANLANSGLGALTSGVQAVGGTAQGVGSLLSNPMFLLAGGGILLLVLLKK